MVMGAMEDDYGYDHFDRTKEYLLRTLRQQSHLLLDNKFEELIARFRGRFCISEDLDRDLEDDPRRVHTWPGHGEQPEIEGDIDDLRGKFPDNVYAEGLTNEQMIMLNYLSKNLKHKNLQAEHGFAADADLKHQTDLLVDKRKLFKIDEYEDSPQKDSKRRGRKNRFFK